MSDLTRLMGIQLYVCIVLQMNLILPVLSQVPSVTTTQTSYSVNQGATVTISCNVQSTTTVTTVYWQRNVGGFITTINVAGNPNKYSGGSSSTPSLTIANAANDDSGIYTCFAANAFGTGSSAQSDLAVIIPNAPTITVSQGSYSAQTGNSVTLGCSVSSATTVIDVYWQRTVGSTITVIRSNTNVNKYQGASVGTPSLTILNSESGDSGNYVCFAVNVAGISRSPTTTLSVTSNTLPTVTISQNAYTANSGSSITLGCSISSSTTITDVYWRKTVGGTFTDIRSSTNPTKYSGVVSGNPSLTISNVDSNDAGNYVCYSTNSAGTALSGTTTLTVISQSVPSVSISNPSYSVLAGGSIQLACTVSSTLSVTIVYWQRNVSGYFTRIDSITRINKYSGSTPSTPSLTILNADQSDAGNYQCFATNSVGTGQSATTTLTVSSVPIVSVLQNSYSGSSGSNIVLQCTVSSTSSSVTGVYWQRNVGGTITMINSDTNINKYSGSTVSTPSLTVYNLGTSDAGLYTCFATNDAGTGHSSATTLTIASNPPTVTLAQQTYIVMSGQSVTLVCTVTSNLTITSVYWQKNVGGTITIFQSISNTNKFSGSTVLTPSLTIFDAAESDVGFYTCFASNSAGTGQSSSTTLSVTEGSQRQNENFSTISIAVISVVTAALVVFVIITFVCWMKLTNSKKSNNRKSGRPETYEIQTSQRDHHYYDSTDVYDRIRGPETIQNEVSFINIPGNRGSSSDYQRAPTEREHRYLEVT